MRTLHCSGRLLGGGGVCLGEGLVVSAQGGVCQNPPPVDRMTDAYENITFPQLLLWTAKIICRACIFDLNHLSVYTSIL